MPSDPNIPKLTYSINEACKASSLGRTTIYGHIRAKRLQAVRIGGRTVIPAVSLMALLGVGVGGDVASGSGRPADEADK
jgi:excisionase family DNA binding protein